MPTRIDSVAQPSMDYDLTDIPSGYDRGRDHGPEVLNLWLDVIEHCIRGQTITRILDLGCGTGRFSQGLATRFRADLIGIDPSRKMLQLARTKGHDGRVRYQPGAAEAIPLQDRSVDMVFMSMSFHHFTDPALAARECGRVLREEGRLLVRTGTRERISAYPYVQFFPSTRLILKEVLPDVARLREVFHGAGLELIASELIQQTIAPDWPTYAEKLSAGGDSVLARLDAQELIDGLARMRGHVAAGNSQAVVEPIDLLVFRHRAAVATEYPQSPP